VNQLAKYQFGGHLVQKLTLGHADTPLVAILAPLNNDGNVATLTTPAIYSR